MRKIVWLLSEFGVGSGGYRTIFQNAVALTKRGYQCDFYLNKTERTSEEIRETLSKYYGVDFPGEIICGGELGDGYDMAIATYNATAKLVAEMDVKHKLYFVQDYEPWFFPMSENYIEARSSYELGLDVVTIGTWLEKYIEEKFSCRAGHFSFGADLQVYRRDAKIEKENAICFIHQPEKPRRCSAMGLRALQIVQAKRPDVKIYLYGSEKKVPFNIKAEHLGLLTTEGCNELYNKCKVGLCLSSTNPSRVPFEMMAAGLPVVDFYLKNNLYDFPEDGCLLAEPSAEALATAILRILDDEKLQRKLSVGGERYMRDFPLEREFEEFGKVVDIYFDDKSTRKKHAAMIYGRGAVKASVGDVDALPVYFRTFEDIEREAEEERRRLEAERKKKEEEEWRANLTIPQRVYLKIRYKLIGR